MTGAANLEEYFKDMERNLWIIQTQLDNGMKPAGCMKLARSSLESILGELERSSLVKKCRSLAGYGYEPEEWEKRLIGYAREFMLLLFSGAGVLETVVEANRELEWIRGKAEAEGVSRDWNWLFRRMEHLRLKLYRYSMQDRVAADCSKLLAECKGGIDRDLKALDEGDDEKIEKLARDFDAAVKCIMYIERQLTLKDLEKCKLKGFAEEVNEYMRCLKDVAWKSDSPFWYVAEPAGTA